MRRQFFLQALLVFAIFALFLNSKSQQDKTSKQHTLPEISFVVSMSKPWTHLLEVEMHIKNEKMPEKIELVMPVWTPGSYMIREYSRHVQDFEAKGKLDGKSLRWQKTSKNVWQIETKGSKEILVTYRVYANELTVRTNELNHEHAFWNNTALLFYVKGWLNAPSKVKVIPYGNWKVATALPEIEPNVFYAENFDILYDSPFEVSDFKEITFSVRGIPHRFVVTGEGNYDLEQIAKDTAKIVEEHARIFGELPYKNYLFILNLRGRGGLEHLNSTALQWGRFDFKPRERYLDFLSLVAHEHFHAWNVKRIRPDALGPFDYSNENYTKLLWVAEGATSYYEGVVLLRAGFITPKEFLETKASQIQALQTRPGRFQTSLEEASFDAWIKFYRQDENSINNQISYYDKGEIVSFLLDLKIRSSSGGRKSLDDVFRHLYNEFYKKQRNYTPEDFQRACELMAGSSLEDFFARYVRAREEIDYNSILKDFGLQLIEPSGKRAFLGGSLSQQGDRLIINSIPADTPAYNQGLNAGDQIVAIDGYRASNSFLQNYLNEKNPGDKVKITVFRFDKLMEFEIILGSQFTSGYRIKTVENPNEQQQILYRSYFGVELK
ncbi:MAG: PDZ domain-containing protein [Pyrinomonadaceae bacterium]|nr:PDZ domain-containing protein [Pyrinomonadaceae bacterium]